MLSFADPAVKDLLASLPEEKWTAAWWLILRDGTPVPGSSGGGVALLKEMHLTRWLGRLLTILHLSALVDALDHFVAIWRGRLSRFVPDGPALHRYP